MSEKTGFIQSIVNFINEHRAAAIAAGATASIAATNLAISTTPVRAEGIQQAMQRTCSESAITLNSMDRIDFTNAKSAKIDLINYFSEVDPINAQIAKGLPDIGHWEQPTDKYKKGRYIVSTEAMTQYNSLLAAAKNSIAQTPELCQPHDMAEAPAPVVETNRTVSLEGMATIGGTYKETKQYDMATGSAEISLNVVVTDDRGNLLYGGGLVNMTLPTDLNLDSSIAVPGLNAETDGLVCYGGRAGVGTTFEGGHQVRGGVKYEHCQLDVDFTYEGNKIGSATPEGNFISGEVMYVSPDNIVVSGSAGIDPETDAKKAELRIGVKTDLLGGRGE